MMCIYVFFTSSRCKKKKLFVFSTCNPRLHKCFFNRTETMIMIILHQWSNWIFLQGMSSHDRAFGDLVIHCSFLFISVFSQPARFSIASSLYFHSSLHPPSLPCSFPSYILFAASPLSPVLCLPFDKSPRRVNAQRRIELDQRIEHEESFVGLCTYYLLIARLFMFLSANPRTWRTVEYLCILSICSSWGVLQS